MVDKLRKSPAPKNTVAKPNELQDAFLRRTRQLRARIRHTGSVEELAKIIDHFQPRYNVPFLASGTGSENPSPQDPTEVLAELAVFEESLKKLSKLLRIRVT